MSDTITSDELLNDLAADVGNPDAWKKARERLDRLSADKASMAVGYELEEVLRTSPSVPEPASEPMIVGDISDLDRAAEAWAQGVGWRAQLDQMAQIATGIAGKRVDGPAGAELKMMILRQRNLIDRWVRQAFCEGLVARQSADERLADLEELFDLTWEADMRAVKRWREAHPGNELVMPDRADMVVWLLETYASPIAAEGRETGWLLEQMDRAGRPTWWAFGGEDGGYFTDDSVKALRFARKEDAQAFIDDIGWNAVAPTEHEWVDPGALPTSAKNAQVQPQGREQIIEECAKAAEAALEDFPVEFGFHDGARWALREIAKAIRALASPSTGDKTSG